MPMKRGLTFLVAGLALAHGVPASAAEDSAAYVAEANALRKSRNFWDAAASIAAQYDRIVKDAILLTEIPAPTFSEEARAKAFRDMLSDAGLADVRIDAIGNVVGVLKGSGERRPVAIVAHLDTVFDSQVSVKVKREGNILSAPGIGDDTFALAVLAAYVRALKAAGIVPEADLLFVGSVGEEGLGDLRGMRALMEEGEHRGRIGSVIVMEPARPGELIATGVGSIRYRVTFQGPGGHSFGDFGMVSPAFALGHAMADISNIVPDKSSRTTFNVGQVAGGTSVNSIPLEMAMAIDMRSESPEALTMLDARVRKIVEAAVERENRTRSTAKGAIRVTFEPLGRRPAGHTPLTSPLVRRARAAMETGGLTLTSRSASTDANIPMSLGIPAIVIGHGIHSERGHSLEEFVTLDRDNDIANMATALVAILLEAGTTKR